MVPKSLIWLVFFITQLDTYFWFSCLFQKDFKVSLSKTGFRIKFGFEIKMWDKGSKWKQLIITGFLM